jgi:hypothetical protein
MLGTLVRFAGARPGCLARTDIATRYVAAQVTVYQMQIMIWKTELHQRRLFR